MFASLAGLSVLRNYAPEKSPNFLVCIACTVSCGFLEHSGLDYWAWYLTPIFLGLFMSWILSLFSRYKLESGLGVVEYASAIGVSFALVCSGVLSMQSQGGGGDFAPSFWHGRIVYWACILHIGLSIAIYRFRRFDVTIKSWNFPQFVLVFSVLLAGLLYFSISLTELTQDRVGFPNVSAFFRDEETRITSILFLFFAFNWCGAALALLFSFFMFANWQNAAPE